MLFFILNRVLIFYLIVLAVCVSSLSIKGPSSTRYEPCGLGLLYFDKSPTDKMWMGVLNFALQPNLASVNVELSFKVPILFAQSTHNSFFVRDNSRSIRIRPRGKVPKRFIFFLQLKDDVVPVIKSFSLNNEVLCSDNSEPQKADLYNLGDNSEVHVCGRRSQQFTELSTVDGDAKTGQFPWHVAIFIRENGDPNMKKYYCGGSIISKTSILTAAHCVRKNGYTIDPRNLVIYAGTADIKDLSTSHFQNIKAKKIVIHPSYNETLATADLAIIKVDAFKFTEYVQPICIWGPVYEKRQLYGLYATMVGFGETEDGIYPQVLRSINTMIQSDETCLSYAPNLYPRLLDEFTFCAGFGPDSNINPRNGDSGGGLVLPIHQADGKISWFVRGVLSKCGMDDGCTSCDPKYYVVYTDVASHYSWIYHHSGLKFRSNIIHL